MEKIVFPIAIAAVLLVFNAKILSFPIAPPHPLCLQQFALANQACSLIPYDHAVPTSVDKPGIFTQVSNDSDEDDGDEGEEDSDEGEGDGDDEGDDDDEDDGEDRQSGQDHGNRGGHGGSSRHHSPRASGGGHGNGNASGSGSNGSSGGGSGTRHGRRRGHGSGHRQHSGEEHGHRSRRRHRRHHSESRESSECCKWLEEVDASCVCDLLIRLPNFLRRPSHAIMIKVQDSCNVTYDCPGRFLE
ncbi:hypothetical protein FRX31_023128 [Thalictrum thalictroides]|nr:hypothetical protein FRX31_023128 [Thalictrum thalictroides]